MDTESMDLAQLDATVGEWEKAQEGCDASTMEVVVDVVRREAFKAHLEARQLIDIRSDLLARLQKAMEDTGPYNEGDSVWYWKGHPQKIRCGLWIKTRVTSNSNEHGQVGINIGGAHVRVNRTKLKRCPDCWHDVVIPGLEGNQQDEQGNPICRDGIPAVPEGDEDDTAGSREHEPYAGSFFSCYGSDSFIMANAFRSWFKIRYLQI